MTASPYAVIRAGIRQAEARAGSGANLRVIVVLALVTALSSVNSATIGASASQLRHALGISNFEIGLMVAVSSGVGAAMTIPMGALVDRVDRTRLLALAIGSWALLEAAAAASPSYGYLVGVQVGLGAATAVGGPAVASLLGDSFSAEERGRVYGYVLGGEVLGAGVGFVVSGLLAAVSWRACLGVVAIPAAVLPVFVWRLPEPPRRAAPHRVDGTPSKEAVPAASMSLRQAVLYVLRVRTNVVLIVSSACSYYFFAGVRAFGLEFAKSHFHVGQATATGLTILIGFGVLVGVLSGGRMADRLESSGRAAGRILLAAAGVELATVLFVPALLVPTAWVAVPLLIAAAAAQGAANPALDAARLQIMPPRLWGRAEGVRTVLRQGAESAAPALFGLVADQLGGDGRSGLQMAFLVMLVPLAASGLILLTARRSYPAEAARGRQAGGDVTATG